MSSSRSSPTRSASPSNREASETSSVILTPRRKIKAMLAAFDDDSEVDSSTPTTRHIVSRHDLGSIENEKTPERLGIIRDDDDADDDAGDDDIVPKGRMAARMRARQRTDEIGSSSSDEAERAYKRITRLLNESQQGSSETETECEKDSSTPSEDELPTTGPKRRLRKARNLASDEDPQRQSRQRSVSPLFVPLSGTGHRGSEEPELDDNNGLELRLKLDSRVLALVEQKRKKREDKERIEEEKKAARAERMKRFSSEIFSSEDSDDDDGSARKLTQQSRPTRKAGKKALEEMNRETQRMSRNMELTHQAKTKKKITKESFFARFNSMQTQGMERSQSALATPSMNSSSPLPSDVEGQKEYISPLTSPLCDPAADTEKPLVDINQQADELMDLPSIEDILTREYDSPEPVIVEQTEIAGREELHTKKAKAFPKLERKPLTKQSVRVRISRQVVAQLQKDGSDSDLEVITSPAKCRRIAIFENLPAQMTQESSSILKLKTLAHLTSPTRRSRAMTSAELSTMLRIRARQQAAKEREERIRELRAKGMVIETAEERAAMEADVEDLMEKARKEAEEISRKEKASRKKENKHADIGDSEDEDYELSGSDDADDNDPGNRDEDGGNGEEDDETTSHQGTYRLVDGEAEEAGDSEDDHIDLYDDLYDATSDDDRETPVTAVRRKRPARVILDDEDEEQGSTQITPAKASPESLKRPQFLNALTSSNLTMGLSQAFAATLGNSRLDTEEDSLNIIRSLPDPGLPVVDLLQAGSQVMVKDSQEQPGEPVDLLDGFTQSDVRVSESPAPRTWSQVSQIPDPTQDAGFVLSPFDQSKRFLELPASTIDTLILPESESPTKRKKSRMLRGRRVAELSDIEEERDGEGSFESKANVFDIMRKASRKSAVPFDKSNSKAKEIVDEAAEESEDEYAGLGGGSDDNASEEDEYDKEMINDNSGEVVDEKELAALNANHQRAMDEKQVSKLLKDITSGALHRRRGGGNDLDLDDSDDERMARRRQKQREFAKMRKALLADEKIGEIADNPKKRAFFKAIEDLESEDEADLDFGFLDEENNSENNTSSQDVRRDAVAGENLRTEDKKRKRPLEPSAADVVNRPPPHLRRTAANVVSRKPSTLAEIRETLSFLIATPEHDSFHDDTFLNEDEDAFLDDRDGSSQENEAVTAVAGSSKDVFPIHHNRQQARDPVVDRLALLREASSNSAPSKSVGKVAFYSASAVDAATSIGFRPPSLSRRTTTSLNDTSSNASRPQMGPPATSHSKKGAVNYYTAARERERERELRVKQQGNGSSIASLLSKQRSAGPGGLDGFLARGEWE